MIRAFGIIIIFYSIELQISRRKYRFLPSILCDLKSPYKNLCFSCSLSGKQIEINLQIISLLCVLSVQLTPMMTVMNLKNIKKTKFWNVTSES